jgi:hypothetical protein
VICRTVARERVGKHVSVDSDALYNRNLRSEEFREFIPRGGAVEYLYVALRVVGGDEK